MTSTFAIHPAATDSAKLAAECDTRRLRRSGPGGQNRNKVETAIVLTHRSSGIVAEANERRSQAENLQVALFRLRVSLALEIRIATAIQEIPSALWQKRCQGGRIRVSVEHDDFPTMLAEVLDVLAASEMDLKLASATLACTPSQLTRFLKLEPRALLRVNQERGLRGLHGLV